MRLLGVLCCTFAVCQVEGLKKSDGDRAYDRPCAENCSAENAEDCCLLGEPFGEVEREARAGISTANEALRRVEEALLELIDDADERQRMLTTWRKMGKVLRLTKRSISLLCGVKLKLARFATHPVVGAAAKQIYHTVRAQGVLLINIILWACDEIAGEHRPPPTINGFGPCGGHWPCQPTLTCTTGSCEGDSENPFVLPMPQNLRTHKSTSYARSSDSYSNSYTPNPRFPLPESPYFILEPPAGGGEENKQSTEDLYGNSSENERNENKSSHRRRSQKRVQLPENYYKYRTGLIPNGDTLPKMIELPNPYLFDPRLIGLFDPPPPRKEKRRFRHVPDEAGDTDSQVGQNGGQHRIKNVREQIFGDQDQNSPKARELVDPNVPFVIKVIGVDHSEDDGGTGRREKEFHGIPRAYKISPRNDIPDFGAWLEEPESVEQGNRNDSDPYLPLTLL
ncbi:hypothetical protein GE061_008228 [Apolygus lucorum]|uniref:WAP domain-containing protein n=1 Tax=Apolygus lucorum TaxID=248454 RepID=A0A6A4J0X9_APOLU|nr:hypothetical protein GE061_008228 [Apolygus lucorum]